MSSLQPINTPPNALTYHVPSPLYCFFYVFSSSLSFDLFFLQTHLLHCLISLNRPDYSLSFLNFSFHNLHSHQKNIKDNYYYFSKNETHFNITVVIGSNTTNNLNSPLKTTNNFNSSEFYFIMRIIHNLGLTVSNYFHIN